MKWGNCVKRIWDIWSNLILVRPTEARHMCLYDLDMEELICYHITIFVSLTQGTQADSTVTLFCEHTTEKPSA